MSKIVKTNLSIYAKKVGNERRQELLEQITKSDTALPESILHEDLDRGMMDFVNERLKVIANGTPIPVNEIIFTTQRWIEYTQTWANVDQDNNVKLPFITIIREPDPQPGSNPTVYTIPDRKNFTYTTIRTFDGNQMGATIYKIPQPVAVDITYEVVLVCDKMRELNRLNKKVLQTFSSRQAYTKVKGHFIPIILEDISDDSTVDDLEGRRFFQQSYKFTLQGILIDEEEFEVVPAINRTVIVTDLVKPQSTRHTIVTRSVDVEKLIANGDGTKTVFSVGEKIGLLIGVIKNGRTLTRGTDYNHNEGTSNIIFTTAPGTTDTLTFFYVAQKSIRLYSGDVVTLTIQEYTSVGGDQYGLPDGVNGIVYVTVDGALIEFTYDAAEQIVTLSAPADVDAKVMVYTI